jgi:heat-inducible transcriptional repressor
MSDLESLGYINHPHTSAGRVPTDLGYRFYVDSLMEIETLSRTEQAVIRKGLDGAEDPSELLKECARFLGRISQQLWVVTPPRLNTGTFEKLELIPLVGNRIIVILSITSGIVRTIMMEVASEVRRERLDELSRFLNERLSGLTLQEIRNTFTERVRDARDDPSGLIRLFIDSVDKLFIPPPREKVHIGGADQVIAQPEFAHPENFRSVIELINNEEMIVHVLEKHPGAPRDIRVTVGGENDDEKLKPYSVIATTYTIGDVSGSLGVIGPKRMQYARMIPLVDFVAKAISHLFAGTPRT